MNKCLTLLYACKKETPLSKTSAEDTITQYNRAQVFLNDLEVSMEKYLTLVTQTYREEDYPPVAGAEGEAVDGLQVLIDKNIESLTDYTNKFIEIRGTNLEIFNNGLAIARPVFWKPGFVYVCMYVTHFKVCLEPYISLNSWILVKFWIINLMTKPNKPYDTILRLDPSI